MLGNPYFWLRPYSEYGRNQKYGFPSNCAHNIGTIWGHTNAGAPKSTGNCCVALPTKQKMRYGLCRQIVLKPGFGQNLPLKFPLGRSTPLRYVTGAVLPTEASKGHTTPGRTQPSHDIVSYVVGLALVLLEKEKSGAPLPCSYILFTAAL